MDQEQWKEFGTIAQMCDSHAYGSINVASKVRSDAVLAAYKEIQQLRYICQLVINQFDKIADDKWATRGMKVAVDWCREATEGKGE